MQSNNTNNNNLLNLYFTGQYNKLANSNLSQPIDQNGNTIMHVIASNLNKNALESILKQNPNAITHNIINTPNNKSELPIHKAMESVQKSNSNHDFITYLIERLGANPGVPDANNRIIVTNQGNFNNPNNITNPNNPNNPNNFRNPNNPNNLNNPNVNQNDNKINQLNNEAILNFQKFTKMAENKLGEISPGIKKALGDMGISSNNLTRLAKEAENRIGQIIPDLKKSSNITYNMKGNNTFSGGQLDQEKRNIEAIKNLNRFYLGQNKNNLNINNSFVATNKSKLLNNYNQNQYSDRLRNEQEFIRNSRLVGGENNNRNNNNNNIIGGRSNNIFDDDDEEYFANAFRVRNNDVSDNEDDIDLDINTRQISNFRDSISNQSRPRPRNTAVDETYRSFINKIMDLLGVDEETARFYRAAIKIEIENKNPELRGRRNDELKVKEMERIFADRDTLQKAIDDIDMDKIKQTMEERRAYREKRIEEIRKSREDRSRQKRNTDQNTSSDNVNDTTTTNTTDTDTTSTETSKKNPRRTTRRSQVAENGYLQSDEVILSSER
ncbi:hypothetical protein H012_gp604 [Acanthamoeba polyphaga moumouvirus]|uniref:Ankyrin repeat protein n=1 Tax=Acanthamoeba polyphaga moumouvirus TaxID=1269028 RepID=L7RBI6_9VIRU|nr:hypothetical protein H012_gp604 [Acanthamoeba polyphaga moumouvirus]AGC01859.1 hypothetical protein Moumou_00319 [Acanthamoeba polyphaga moumouvirus]AQN68218.1 hypothetical protein [Saudi moumouvirus]